MKCRVKWLVMLSVLSGSMLLLSGCSSNFVEDLKFIATNGDSKITHSEDKYLKVLDTYKTESKRYTGKVFITTIEWYIVVDADGVRRDIKVTENVFKQVIQGDSINCRIGYDDNSEIVRVDIIVAK